MASAFASDFLDQVYLRLDPRRLFQRFELVERGQRYVGRCPKCGKRELYVLRFDPRYHGLRARCNRLNHCGFSISAWDYLREVEGVADRDVPRALAERAGVEYRGNGAGGLPAAPLRFAAQAGEAALRRERRAALCERFWNWAGELLWKDARFPGSDAARTAALLKNRGYSETLARAMGLALLPPVEVTRAFLLSEAGVAETELRELPFLDAAFDRRAPDGRRIYTLAVPYPERQSLVARTTLPASELPSDAPKYRYPRGLRLDAPAFLASVDRRRPVLVVEGFLDAALAHALAATDARAPDCLAQFVATGSNRLNAAQVQALSAAGARQLVLCFDNDDLDGKPSPDDRPTAGVAGTSATLDRLAEAGTFFPRVLRLPAELNCKDPDEVLTRRGPAAFARLVEEHTETEASFRARLLSRPLAREGAARNGAQQRVLAELAEVFEREAGRPARSLFLNELTELMAKALGLEPQALAAALAPFRRQAALGRRAELLRAAALAVTTRLGGAGAPEAEALSEAGEELRRALARADEAGGGEAAPLEPVRLEAYVSALAERAEMLPTPYRKLDEAAAIHPGRITLVAARPSHGKTTFLLNLLVHWLKLYPDKRFVVFSYDGPRAQLLSQMLSRLTRRYSLRELEEFWRGETGGHPESEELSRRARAALRWLAARGAGERLYIVDQALTVQELCRSARALAAAGPLGAVLVDYIQQVRAGRRFDTRQREVGYVSRALQGLAQETGVPVVAAAQLNRVSESAQRTDRPRLWQLREAGDLEQDATTVYGLYNHHQAAAELQSDEYGEGGSENHAARALWRGGTLSSARIPSSRPPAGACLPSPGDRQAAPSACAAGRRRRADRRETAPALAPGEVTGTAVAEGARWVAPAALRAVALDVEVLKAKHGRTHVRIPLTYDLVANYITDGKSDGRAECEEAGTAK